MILLTKCEDEMQTSKSLNEFDNNKERIINYLSIMRDRVGTRGNIGRLFQRVGRSHEDLKYFFEYE